MTTSSNVVLTRYLYDKEGVFHSLAQSIRDNDYEAGIFWAYELYYSGFRKEVLNFLWKTYTTTFYPNHPKLGVYIRSKIDIDKPACIATIIKNFTMKNPDIQESAKVKFVNVKEYHIEEHKTLEPFEKHKWKYLGVACKYSLSSKEMSETEKAERLAIFRTKWLYHAAFSPVWSERILEYSGRIQEASREVLFGEHEDAFYDRYGFEPDEQSLELQKKCMGL